MEAKECAEYKIHMTDRCSRKYNKAGRRFPPRLHGLVESELASLQDDPCRGSELVWNLSGLRSIHIDQFSYRIVYEIDRDTCTITIIAIDHRSSIYDELARLRQDP